MRTDVTAHMDITVEFEATIVFAIAVARGVQAAESLDIVLDGKRLTPTELGDEHGTRLHAVAAPAGKLIVDYRATVTGVAEAAPVEEIDMVRYLRPSRYCE